MEAFPNSTASSSFENLLRPNLRPRIPYVETFEEQTTRTLWETNPFCGARSIVETTIQFVDRDQNNDTPLPVDPNAVSVSSNGVVNASGYEDSFDQIYSKVGTSNLGGNQEGSVSCIQASPYAFDSDDEGQHQVGRRKQNFCLHIAYKGDDFCGWQTQPNNLEKPSVQRTLEELLTELQNNDMTDGRHPHARRSNPRQSQEQPQESNDKERSNNKAKRRDTSIKWADLPVAGRTDRGVSAIGQVCRFRTHRTDLTADTIRDYVNDRVRSTPSIANSLRLKHIEPVSKSYHPTFSTTSRAYVYLVDVEESSLRHHLFLWNKDRAVRQCTLLNAMLQKLEGRPLDYVGLSYGKVKTSTTICTLHHARARLVQYQTFGNNSDDMDLKRTAVCIELVGDRFLRRMVRLLVEASMRLVARVDFWNGSTATGSTSHDDDLLNLVKQKDRSLLGRPAPPNGLIFVGTRVPST